MTHTDSKTARLDFRLDEDLKQLIERAAASLGQSVSTYALSTLAERSRQVVEQGTLIQLSRRDWERLRRALDADAKPSSKLRRAASRHERSVIR